MKTLVFLFITIFISANLFGQIHDIDEEYRIQNNLPLLAHSNDPVYKLTDADVIVENGSIIDCSYAFRCQHLIIPDTLDGQLITSIGYSVGNEEIKGIFSRLYLSNVKLPTSIKKIGNYAFANNNFRRLDLSHLTQLETIGIGAFQNNKLKSIRLRGCENLRLIGKCAFLNTRCSFKLPVNHSPFFIGWVGNSKNIIQPGDSVQPNVSEIHVLMSAKKEYYTLRSKDVVVRKGIIESCSYDYTIRNIRIPSFLSGQTICGIGDVSKGLNMKGVFEEVGLTSVELPSTITQIGPRSFRNNYLRSIDLSNVAHICDYAFSDNNLKEMKLGSETLKRIGAFAFENNQLKELDLRDNKNLNSIETGAFRENNLTVLHLPKVSIPQRFVVQNMDAFANNPVLKE